MFVGHQPFENILKIKAEQILLFLLPALFLSLKGWVNGISIIVAIFCAYAVFSNWEKYFTNRDRLFWFLLLCIIIPFFGELFAQIGRSSIIFPSLDGPSRTLLAGIIFVYFSRKSLIDCDVAIGWGAVTGIASVLVSIVFFKEAYWSYRMATYFVDPITLPCYLTALLGLVVFSNLSSHSRVLDVLVKLACVIAVLYVCIGSSSRSSWVALLVLAELFILLNFKGQMRTKFIAHIFLMICVLLVYFSFDAVNWRINAIFMEVRAFIDGDANTSIGHRLGLVLLDLHLIWSNLLFGVADSALPTLEAFKESHPTLPKELYEIKMLSGSHNEILGQLVTRGIVFGGLSVLSLFVVPIYFLIRELRNNTRLNMRLSKMSLGFIVPIFFAGMTIQVFNLKMTITFYSLFLAFLYAQIIREKKTVV